MKKYILSLCALSLAFGACEKAPQTPPNDPQRGAIVFDCSISPQVAVAGTSTKADPVTRELPAACLPAVNQMGMKLSSQSTALEYQYETMDAYDQPWLDPGDYTVEFSYGDPEAEGPDAACFAGTSTCTVVARKVVTHPVVHTLSNSLYTVELSDWFKNYYSEYHLTIHTESGYQSSHTSADAATKATTEPTPIFVKPATKLYLSGTATKTNGVQVEFPKTEIGTTMARTWHTVQIDAGSTGQAGLKIHFNDTLISVDPQEIELNPEA